MGHAGTEALQADLRAFQLGPLGLVPCNVAKAVAPTVPGVSPHPWGWRQPGSSFPEHNQESSLRPLPGVAQRHTQATCICESPGGPGGTAGL